MREAAEQEAPDLMLVEGICCDVGELTQVEYVTTHYPQIAVVLLCATTSPDFLIRAMRAGVREVLPLPLVHRALHEAHRPHRRKLGRRRALRNGKVLAFIACKGGSGATFLSTNFGYALARWRQERCC